MSSSQVTSPALRGLPIASEDGLVVSVACSVEDSHRSLKSTLNYLTSCGLVDWTTGSVDCQYLHTHFGLTANIGLLLSDVGTGGKQTSVKALHTQ